MMLLFGELDEPNPLPVCEQFVMLVGTDERDDPECKVCDHLEMEHTTLGRRALSTEEIHAIRERMIDKSYAVEVARGIADQAYFDSQE
jgi:hypothetical protein